MADTKAKGRKFSPEEQADLVAEVKRLLDESGVKHTLTADVADVKACPGCIVCTCMICI